MNEQINEIVELLEELLEDAPFKVRTEIEIVIKMLNGNLNQEELIKVQDQLELISNMGNVDSYIRSEVLNILSTIESFI